MSKTIIIEDYSQYGYGTIHSCYAEQNFAKQYNFVYICIDRGEKHYSQRDNIEIIYIKEKNRWIRKYKLIKTIIAAAKQNKRSVLILPYFRCVSLVRLFLPKYKIVCDYSTGCVHSNAFNRFLKNSLMTFESLFFNKFTSLSVDIVEHLHLPIDKTTILPLASEIKSTTEKHFNELHLLYVGTLATQRDINKTIYGVVQFKKRHPEITVSYDISGKGNGKDLIQKEIDRHNANDYIKLLGFVPDSEIKQYYDKCNVGVCYARMTDAYIAQPFTKLYEYGLAGMPVVSVKLKDSVRRVIPEVGVLCDDNEISFSDALEQLWSNRNSYNSNKIRQYFSPYTFENIGKLYEKFWAEL